MNDLVTTILRTRQSDPVAVAFYALARLDEAERAAVVARFNRSFGQCTPPLSVAFTEAKQ